MKKLHRDDFYGWSAFNPERDLDFHSVLWVRADGNVVVDPLPLGPHDERHLRELGGVHTILVSNSDHVRDSRALADATGARILGPAAERKDFPVRCDAWLADGDVPLPGVRVFECHGSKTPGELAFLIEDHTLITGDLIRGHRGGRLNLLPEPKLSDPQRAAGTVQRLAAEVRADAVLVGDGWPIFRDGVRAMQELANQLG